VQLEEMNAGPVVVERLRSPPAPFLAIEPGDDFNPAVATGPLDAGVVVEGEHLDRPPVARVVDEPGQIGPVTGTISRPDLVRDDVSDGTAHLPVEAQV
jgi:hypothetical protein